MKIKMYLERFLDVNLEELVDRIFEDVYFKDDWDEVESYIEDDLTDGDYYEVSDREKEEILAACKKRYYLEKEKYKQKELEALSNRKEVLKWLQYGFDRDNTDPGDIGYLLTPEEILDTILKNAKTLSK